MLCSNKLEHCTAAQQNAQPPPLHFCRTDNILRTSGAAEANLDRRPLRAAEDEHAADQPRVARCVEINCNALHAIDAMGSMAWDSLVYLRTGQRCPAGSSAATCYWSSPTVRTIRRSSEPEAHDNQTRETTRDLRGAATEAVIKNFTIFLDYRLQNAVLELYSAHITY